MKKLGLIAMLAAGSMFAASISNSSNKELYSMIENADAKTLSEISFEIHKRIGNIKSGFRDAMHNKISNMSDESRVKFMQEYRQNMHNKMDLLTVKEARDMGFGNMMGKKSGTHRGLCQKQIN